MATKESELTAEEKEEGLQFLNEVLDVFFERFFREAPGLIEAEFRRQQNEARAYLTKQLG